MRTESGHRTGDSAGLSLDPLSAAAVREPLRNAAPRRWGFVMMPLPERRTAPTPRLTWAHRTPGVGTDTTVLAHAALSSDTGRRPLETFPGLRVPDLDELRTRGKTKMVSSHRGPTTVASSASGSRRSTAATSESGMFYICE
ncbi:hypothetical protein GCM10023323_68170 [Streptomyces thinghirensis]|uniref:Uncharacterized protein n=1 Tax=Streptomyces thinghirensis TaxID=551547 RepID=A0ABP9TCI6_9ACTN